MDLVAGRTFVVTGGASGLGEATARAFHKAGANVALVDLNLEEGQKLSAELNGKRPRSAIFCQADITSEEAVLQVIADAKKAFQQLHGAINCAGVGSGQRTISSRGPHNLGLFKKVIEINLVGTFNVCRLVAQAMLEQEPGVGGERGVLINTASVAAYEGQIGQVAYSASKGGVVGMTIVLARDLARYGIRAVTIAPGTFDTPLMGFLPDEQRQKLADATPFPPRLGRPEEFGRLAVHIAQNQMLNGETIRLDGALRMAAL